MRTIRFSILLLLSLATFSSNAFNLDYLSATVYRHWDFSNSPVQVPTNSLNRTTHAIRYYISSDGWSTTNTAAELNAVRACFAQWQAIPGASIQFEEAGLAAPGYHLSTSDNSNVVYWATTNDNNTADISGALGFTSYNYSLPAGQIIQFDIVLNGWQYNWFTDFNDKQNPGLFVEGTLAHEIGHALGLNHSSMGGATMLWDGGSGVEAQTGLSVDEINFARTVYPLGSALTTNSALLGTVTKNGSPVLGAAVQISGTNGNMVGSSVTQSNGTYALTALPPGTYNVHVSPLASASATSSLIRGGDVTSAFNGADTTFLATTNSTVTLTTNTTNTLNFTVGTGAPPFHIGFVRKPSISSGSYSWVNSSIQISVGQSNYFTGVVSEDLPTTNVSLTITGDGLTLGALIIKSNLGGTGLNFLSLPISVSSNATPGLRTFAVTQGTNLVYAEGFIEVLPAIFDYNFDGLDDVFQRKYFAPWTSTNAAPNADPDHDGMNNRAEYIAGTDPTSAASYLKLTSVGYALNGSTIRWLGSTNRLYQLTYRTNLTLGSWNTLTGLLAGTFGTNQYFDSTGTNGMRYYRVEAFLP